MAHARGRATSINKQAMFYKNHVGKTKLGLFCGVWHDEYSGTKVVKLSALYCKSMALFLFTPYSTILERAQATPGIDIDQISDWMPSDSEIYASRGSRDWDIPSLFRILMAYCRILNEYLKFQSRPQGR